jgi:hypothetical protein
MRSALTNLEDTRDITGRDVIQDQLLLSKGLGRMRTGYGTQVFIAKH